MHNATRCIEMGVQEWHLENISPLDFGLACKLKAGLQPKGLPASWKRPPRPPQAADKAELGGGDYFRNNPLEEGWGSACKMEGQAMRALLKVVDERWGSIDSPSCWSR